MAKRPWLGHFLLSRVRLQVAESRGWARGPQGRVTCAVVTLFRSRTQPVEASKLKTRKAGQSWAPQTPQGGAWGVKTGRFQGQCPARDEGAPQHLTSAGVGGGRKQWQEPGSSRPWWGIAPMPACILAGGACSPLHQGPTGCCVILLLPALDQLCVQRLTKQPKATEAQLWTPLGSPWGPSFSGITPTPVSLGEGLFRPSSALAHVP